MESSSWLWILLAVVALVVLVAVIMAGRKKKLERDRERAHELREEAATKATDLQKREAHAREVEADAARARAEADRKAAEAERLEAEARERAGAASAARAEHDSRLREADKLDPDVDHKSAQSEVGDHGPTHEGTHDSTHEVSGTDGRPVGHEATASGPRHDTTGPHPTGHDTSATSETTAAEPARIPGQTTRVEEHPPTESDRDLDGHDDGTGRHRA